MGKPLIYRDKLRELREAIRKGEYADKPFPSEAQLMRKFKVGRQTAIRILNGLCDEGLIVRRKGAGTFLSKIGRHATGRIGLIVHGSDYCEIFAPIAKRISQLCQLHDYTLMFGDVSSDCTAARVKGVLKLADRFISGGVDGLVFQPIELVPDAARINRELVKRFSEKDIPVALLDSDIVVAPERSEYDMVAVNHFEVGRTLAGHLIRTGARRVVYLTQADRAPCVQARQLGVKVGCEGLPVPGKAVVAEPDDVAAIRRILRRERPDAIACYNDRQAALLLQTLAKLGRRVPDDIQVVGFDDVQYAKLTIPRLTTMHQPCEEIADAVFGLLMERIRNPKAPAREVLFESKLVVRGSTRTIS